MTKIELEELIKSLSEDKLNKWLEKVDKKTIRFFLNELFTENNIFLSKILRKDKNSNLGLRALVTIIDLPYQTFTLLRNEITTLLISYLDDNNLKGIDNIFWLSSHTSNCCDSLVLFNFLTARPLEYNIQVKMCILLSSLDNELAEIYINQCFENTGKDDFLVLKMENLIELYPLKALDVFTEINFDSMDDKLLLSFEFATMDLFERLIKDDYFIQITREKLSQLKVDWKINLVENIINNNNKYLLFKVESKDVLLFKEICANLRNNILDANYDFILKNSLYPQKLIIKTTVDLIYNSKIELNKLQMKNISNIFLVSFNNDSKNINKYLMEEYKLSFDPTRSVIKNLKTRTTKLIKGSDGLLTDSEKLKYMKPVNEVEYNSVLNNKFEELTNSYPI